MADACCPEVLAAAKPFLAGLLAGLLGSASPLACDPAWLAPIAALLSATAGAGATVSPVAAPPPGNGGGRPGDRTGSVGSARKGGKGRSAKRRSADKENANANVSGEAAGPQADDGATEGVAGTADGGVALARAADHPAVKALLQAAGLAKVRLRTEIPGWLATASVHLSLLHLGSARS